MASMAKELIGRGVRHATVHFQSQPQDGGSPFNKDFELSGVAVGIFAFTAICYFLMSMAIGYTYGDLVPTLAMIETPTATAIIRTSDAESNPDDPLLDNKDKKDIMVEQELLLVQAKPITSSLKGTVRYLRARAGVWSRFRGAGLLISYAILFAITNKVLGHVFSAGFKHNPLRHTLANIGTTVILCRVNMAWTHAVIAEPSSKSAWSRIVGGHTARKIVGPATMVAVIEQICMLVPKIMFKAMHMKQWTHNRHPQHPYPAAVVSMVALKFLSILIVSIVIGVFVLFPLHVALRRVQASLLPEEEESIIPFDRSFGGKVVPEIVGGTGRVTLKDAWTSFDWNARVRLVKVYAKAWAMQVVLAMFFTSLVISEIFMLGGKLNRDGIFAAVSKRH